MSPNLIPLRNLAEILTQVPWYSGVSVFSPLDFYSGIVTLILDAWNLGYYIMVNKTG